MTLEKIRREIDQKDEAIMRLLEERFDLVNQLKAVKKSLVDKEREREILEKTDSEYIRAVYLEIFRNSKKLLAKQLLS